MSEVPLLNPPEPRSRYPQALQQNLQEQPMH
jgi:hypothetical protein